MRAIRSRAHAQCICICICIQSQTARREGRGTHRGGLDGVDVGGGLGVARGEVGAVLVAGGLEVGREGGVLGVELGVLGGDCERREGR